MLEKLFRYIIIAMIPAMWVFSPQVGGLCAMAERDCGSISEDLDQKTSRLSEYVAALQNAHTERDQNFLSVLNGQIDQIINEIRILEKLLVNCPAKPGDIRPPLSSVKTQDDKFAELNCEDLRKKHIILSRKFNALGRRMQSVFSEATHEQKSEYRDTEDSLRLVESELRRRCAPPPNNPFQKKTRSGERNLR